MSEFDIGTHMVQFYEDAAFLLDTLTKLAGTALVAGDAAIIICPWWMGLPEEHSNLRQAVAAVRAGENPRNDCTYSDAKGARRFADRSMTPVKNGAGGSADCSNLD